MPARKDHDPADRAETASNDSFARTRDRSPHGGLGHWLWPVPAAVVAFSLLVRVWYRGPYYPGWDVLGPAHGLFLVSTHSFWDALIRAVQASRHFHYWNPTNSVLFTLVPGYLTQVWPWQYWGHLLTLSLFLITLILIAKVAKLRPRDCWIVFLAAGASPALLSFSVSGYPYVTGFLPHALALWVVLDERLRHRPILSLLLCIMAAELSWHLYELGKTVFVVFLAGAVLVRGVPYRTRIVWIAAGLVQLAFLLAFPGGNVGYFLGVDGRLPTEMAAAVLRVLEAVIGGSLDLPVLVIVGAVSLLFLRNHRWLFFTLLLVQTALFVVLATHGGNELRPRRFLMIEFYCILIVACALSDQRRMGRIAKGAVVTLLLLANTWQVGDLLDYVRTPVTERMHAMPFTHSQADYGVPAHEVDWFREMSRRVELGEKLLLIYNLASYPENTTDPAGVLERLYLNLGHDRFIQSVYVFGSMQCRYSCLPVRPLAELETVLESVAAGEPPPQEVVGYYYLGLHTGYHQYPYERFESEGARIFRAVRDRFAVLLSGQERKLGLRTVGTHFARFRLQARDGRHARDGFVIMSTGAEYRRQINASSSRTRLLLRRLPVDLVWTLNTSDGRYLAVRPWANEPFALGWSGTLRVYEAGAYDFLVGADDRATLTIGSTNLVDVKGAHPFWLQQQSLVLEAGSYPLRLDFTDDGGEARLLFDITRRGAAVSAPAAEAGSRAEAVPLVSLFPQGLPGR